MPVGFDVGEGGEVRDGEADEEDARERNARRGWSITLYDQPSRP